MDVVCRPDSVEEMPLRAMDGRGWGAERRGSA